jgi:TolB-like protein/Tfp pilus assembly protein PilF
VPVALVGHGLRCQSSWFILRSIESDPGHNALTTEPGLAGDPATRGGQRAVFLSYASEDAAAARRVCESLRAAGIEVWFDQSELRGGDVWDHKIRREIRDCALFVAIISQNTQARTEGYFRLEWRLAEQRTHLMAKSRAFLVPVCIDDTLDADADVPDSFLAVQWTRLPGGVAPPAFAARISGLLPNDDHGTPAPIRPVPGGAAATTSHGSLSAQTAVPEKSIAVLPFANLSADKDNEYFSDGLAEEILNALSQVEDLHVAARMSSFSFKGKAAEMSEIATKLHVANVLDGSVRRAGNRIRVMVQLVDARNGYQLWSERYDRPYEDLFALQDDITHAVAGALKVHLLSQEIGSPHSDRPTSGNLEAYTSVLEGKFYFRRDNEAGVSKAIEHFTRATQLDPRYPLAWSLASQAWTSLGANYLTPGPADEAFARARVAAETALALAPALASAHIARGWLLHWADFDWHGAEAEYRRALDLAPADGDAKERLGDVLATLGQVETAIELTREALVSDPLRASCYGDLAYYFWRLNRLEEAETAIRRAIELLPRGSHYHVTLTRIEVARGNAQAALAAAQQEPAGSFQEASVALARQIGNDRDAADAALKNLIDRYTEFFPYVIAEIYALRNEPDRVFEWLDKCWRYREPFITLLPHDPFMRRFKDDSRFSAFCRKFGLPTPAELEHRT